MDFWRWYFRGIFHLAKLSKPAFKFKFKWLISPLAEGVIGGVGIFLLVFIFAIESGILWLLFILPLTTIPYAHAVYREKEM